VTVRVVHPTEDCFSSRRASPAELAEIRNLLDEIELKSKSTEKSK